VGPSGGTEMQVSGVNNTHSYPIAIDKKSELFKACQDFEAIFIKQMLDVMRKTVHKQDDLLNGGMSQDIYEGMLYDEYAKKMAETGQFGLSDMIYKQLASK
jgi:peptidoglycan hydrolase FlgJ